MSWASNHVKRLSMGQTVTFRPGGRSGLGINDRITLEPIGSRVLKRGDIVLCKVDGDEQLVSVAKVGDGQYLVRRDRKSPGTWTPAVSVWGICTDVQCHKSS